MTFQSQWQLFTLQILGTIKFNPMTKLPYTALKRNEELIDKLVEMRNQKKTLAYMAETLKISPATASTMIRDSGRCKPFLTKLTPEIEQDVLRLRKEGKENKVISTELDISISSVSKVLNKFHMTNASTKKPIELDGAESEFIDVNNMKCLITGF